VSPRINAIGSIVFTITMSLVIMAQALLMLRRPARPALAKEATP
jgi:hypothetical protein